MIARRHEDWPCDIISTMHNNLYADIVTFIVTKQGFRLLYKSRHRLEEALIAMRDLRSPEVDQLADFVATSPRGFIR